MQVEATNIFRRAVLAGRVSADVGAQAVADLTNLRVWLFPFEPFAQRVWQLRDTVTSYDAWYIVDSEEPVLAGAGNHCGGRAPPE